MVIINIKFFRGIHINTQNEQQHIFKERMIKKLKLDVFIDDDRTFPDYLKRKLKKVDLVCVTGHNKYFKTL